MVFCLPTYLPFFLISEAAIDDYLDFFRTHFPDMTVSPKMHILEDHIIPFIKRWHFGLGLFDEQGGETIHKEFNQLAARAWGAHSDVEKLRIHSGCLASISYP